MTAAPIAASNAVGKIGMTLRLVGRAGSGRGVNFGASPGAVGDVGVAAIITECATAWQYQMRM